MINRNRILLLITLTFAIFISGCQNTAGTNTDQQVLNKGELAPMFELKDLDGKQVNLADLSGEKVYAKYWASWCSICLSGLEELDTLSLDENDFHVLSIVSPNYNGEMPMSDFITWYESLSIKNSTVLLDEDGVWARKFSVLAYPTSFYIGSDGVLVKTIPGHNSNDIITSEMQKIQ